MGDDEANSRSSAMAEPHSAFSKASLKTACALSMRVFGIPVPIMEWENTLLSNGIQKAVACLILTPFSGFF